MGTLPKYLTQDELKRFFAVINSPRDRALFSVIDQYGLHVDEATLLSIEDLDSRFRGNDLSPVMPAPAYARTGSVGHPESSTRCGKLT